MDSRRFDEISRRLGAATSRRGALAALAGMAAGLDMGMGLDATTGADAKNRRRKRCDPACPAGQTCDKPTRTCRCDNGGAVCGAACCLVGQACQGGQCVQLPEPTTCVAYGEPCKDVGVPCCDGLQCGSGQGGGAVACWVAKTGRCASTAECIYGTECKEGICVGLPQPQPDTGPTCDAATCPTCQVFPGYETAVASACEGGACACACQAGRIALQGFTPIIVSNVSCRTNAECGTFPSSCHDMLTTNYCLPSSKNCCCVTQDPD